MIAIDTSVLVRVLTQDPPDDAERAYAVLQREAVAVPVTVLMEAAHVLRTVYRMPTEAVADALLAAIRRDNVEIVGLSTLLATDALVRARSRAGRPIADAFIAAQARWIGATGLVTFDRRMTDLGIAVVSP